MGQRLLVLGEERLQLAEKVVRTSAKVRLSAASRAGDETLPFTASADERALLKGVRMLYMIEVDLPEDKDDP